MGSGIFGIGMSGLAAAQAGLTTTGHNIANANTEGYHRQRIETSTAVPLRTGSGFFGQGVQVDSVMRVYSRFLDEQVAQSQAQASYYTTYHAQLAQIDGVLADTSAGLSPALQEFFSAVHAVAANPSGVPARQSLLSGGAALASRFQTLNARLDEARTVINSRVASTVNDVNSYAREIAALNQRILVAQQNPSQPPNDLLDQRETLVGELNKLVDARAIAQSDGTVNVFIGNGQNLVVGTQALRLAASPSPADPQRLEVGYVLGATVGLLNESTLQGGSLGALLAFRTQALDTAQNALGRVAVGLAQTFNDQHHLGQDLNGLAGGDFFRAAAPQVITNSGNTGTGAVTATLADVGALTTSDYRLTWTGADYTVTRLSDDTVTTYAALPQTVDGVTLSIAGAPAAGDSFLIRPTRNAARDLAVAITSTSAIAAAAPMRTAAAGGNTGNGAITAGSVNTPPPPDVNLQQPVTITFTSATTFDVTGTGTGNPAGVVYTPGGDITYNGWTAQISGVPAAGDVFTITANTGGVADNRNAQLLAALQTGLTLAGNTTTYQGAYGQLVASVGSQTREMEVSATAQDQLVTESRKAQQAVSGVNLDEEAANLLRYQQAYQASGKMIQIASTLFQTLLELGN